MSPPSSQKMNSRDWFGPKYKQFEMENGQLRVFLCGHVATSIDWRKTGLNGKGRDQQLLADRRNRKETTASSRRLRRSARVRERSPALPVRTTLKLGVNCVVW